MLNLIEICSKFILKTDWLPFFLNMVYIVNIAMNGRGLVTNLHETSPRQRSPHLQRSGSQMVIFEMWKLIARGVTLPVRQ